MLNFRREGTIEVAPGGGLIPSRVEAKSTGAFILQSVSAIPGSPVSVEGHLGHQGRATKRRRCTFDGILIPPSTLIEGFENLADSSPRLHPPSTSTRSRFPCPNSALRRHWM